MRLVLVFLSILSLADAFVAPQCGFAMRCAVSSGASMKPTILFAEKEDSDKEFSLDLPSVASTSAAFWTLTSTMANAAGPDWGIFEGKTLSLLHPVMMLSMLGLSVWTALLGFQWRRQRTIGDDLKALKKQIPDLQGAENVQAAITAARAAETPDTSYISKLEMALPVEEELKRLEAERKDLVQKNPRDRHFSQGALLAAIGTIFAIEGPLNTYGRAGKLFPGPHLYGGAALVCLWAIAFACVPSMQKGNDTARSIHVGANVAGIGMFAWQLQSGIPILLKVIEKTPWP